MECLDYTADEDGVWYTVATMNVRRGLAGATTLGGEGVSVPNEFTPVLPFCEIVCECYFSLSKVYNNKTALFFPPFSPFSLGS